MLLLKQQNYHFKLSDEPHNPSIISKATPSIFFFEKTMTSSFCFYFEVAEHRNLVGVTQKKCWPSCVIPPVNVLLLCYCFEGDESNRLWFQSAVEKNGITGRKAFLLVVIMEGYTVEHHTVEEIEHFRQYDKEEKQEEGWSRIFCGCSLVCRVSHGQEQLPLPSVIWIKKYTLMTW